MRAAVEQIRRPGEATHAREDNPNAVLIDTSLDQQELLYENWGRWCRQRKIFGECNSLEGNYRSPQHWEREEVRIPVTLEDMQNALRVNRAWLAMPQPYKVVFKDWYALRCRPEITCRRCRLRIAMHDEYLVRARLICSNLLTFQT